MEIIFELALKVIRVYVGAFEPLVKHGLRRLGRSDIADRIFSGGQTIDERIQRLDAARENLMVGLQAIDELKASAEENKKELTEALKKLDGLKGEKDAIERQLLEAKNIASADITVFQKLAGVPSGRDKWVERLIGFVAGFVASLLASLAILPFT